jgi:hypothetical protein
VITEQKPLKSARARVVSRPTWCATSPQLEGKGGVYCMDVDIAELISDFTPQRLGQQPTGVLPWAVVPALAEQLWQLSKKMTGVKFSG